MRCGSRLISKSESGDKVVNECSQPTSVDSWEEERYDYFDRLPPANRYREFERYGNAYRVRAFIRVEIWTYNYGPSRSPWTTCAWKTESSAKSTAGGMGIKKERRLKAFREKDTTRDTAKCAKK